MEQTVHAQRAVALLCQRKDISELILLEAEHFGNRVLELSAFPSEPCDYDIIITDKSLTAEELSSISARVIRIVESKGETDSLDVWETPIALADLRCLFLGMETHTDINGQTISVINEKERRLLSCGRCISLTEAEWNIFSALAKAGGEPVSRNALMELLGADNGNIADVYICRLRRKLELPNVARLIVTVRGRGYALRAEVNR